MEAVFALIGVGLGAFISGGFSLVLERRREQTRAREERRQEEQEAFAAARLLRADAHAAQGAVVRALEDDPPSWPIALDPDWARSWGAYRRVMAGELGDDDFDAVARAFLEVEQLERAFRAGRDPDRRALKESDAAFLQASRPTLARALEALGQHTHRAA